MKRYSCFHRLTSVVCAVMTLMLGVGPAVAGDVGDTFALLDPAQATPFSVEDCERLADADSPELGALSCGRPEDHHMHEPEMRHEKHYEEPRHRSRRHPPVPVPERAFEDIEYILYMSFVAVPLFILWLIDPDAVE
ncbi:MAG: hypothetical protein HN341_12280 [Verrucomicrobia bacterium]|jgi:hypothetical protein|nr:hypothetical protein [Verrucomicrobiota bacterium]